MTKKTHDEFQVLEATLRLELKRFDEVGPSADQPAKPKRERPPRDFLVCKLSCKKPSSIGFPTVVTAEVETMSELLARIEAAKMARKLGFYPEDCVEISLEKITR